MNNSPSNPTINLLVEWYGPRRTFEVVMELGGLRHYVPHGGRANVGGRLSSVLSSAELKPLIEAFAGSYIKMPVARQFCVNFLYWVEEKSYSFIAKTLRISEDSVCKTLGGSPPDLLAGVAVKKVRDRMGAQG